MSLPMFRKFVIALYVSTFMLMFQTPSFAQSSASQCSDVLAEYLLTRTTVTDHSYSNYAYSSHYASMTWKQFDDQWKAGGTIPIKGLPAHAEGSREQFEEWQRQTTQSVNVNEINSNQFSLFQSMANTDAIDAWSTCMGQRQDKSPIAHFEPLPDDTYNLSVRVTIFDFGQQPPTLVQDANLSNARILLGDGFLKNGQSLGSNQIITVKRVDPTKPIIFTANTTDGPMSAFVPVFSAVPEWPNEIPVRHNIQYANGLGSTWAGLASPPDNVFPISDITGFPRTGVIISGGVEGKTLYKTHTFASGTWDQLISSPVKVSSLTGNNKNGIAVVSNDDPTNIYYIDNYASPSWKKLAAPIPINSIAGFPGEFLIAGGPSGHEVYHYHAGQWYRQNNAPFRVGGIAGNNRTGIIVYGGPSNDLVAFMDSYAANNWNMLPKAPFSIDELIGNNTDGPTILSYESDRAYSVTNYGSPTWTVGSLPSRRISFASGNRKGLITASKVD